MALPAGVEGEVDDPTVVPGTRDIGVHPFSVLQLGMAPVFIVVVVPEDLRAPSRVHVDVKGKPVVTVDRPPASPVSIALLTNSGMASDMKAMRGFPEASTAMDSLAPAPSTSVTSHMYLAAPVAGGDVVAGVAGAALVVAVAGSGE